jgi:transcriptional regulator with XRE-family HTH domain
VCYSTRGGNDGYLSRVRHEKEGEIFGSTVRRLRLDRGWTQERLAEASGLTTTYVGQVERGVRVPSLTVVLKLARGLAVSPGELLSGFSASVLRALTF